MKKLKKTALLIKGRLVSKAARSSEELSAGFISHLFPVLDCIGHCKKHLLRDPPVKPGVSKYRASQKGREFSCFMQISAEIPPKNGK